MNIADFDIGLKLIIACLPFVLGVYSFFTGKEKLGLALLVLGAFGLRLLMISLDPYLHEWDERFHALVAKNMMANPMVPMLRVHPIIPYNYQDWCCNHIWLHKQPLFMWQMALSMKVFGVNEIAMRLPSAIMGALAVWLTYRIGLLWLKDKTIAYGAALLLALSYYHLEMISGRIKLDHNDVAYHFYVLASIWAYMEYRRHLHKPYAWLLLIGVFVGGAILNKWLTGLLVFAGWGTMVLSQRDERKQLANWLHMALALVIAVLIFLPWQLYVAHAFPAEAAWEQYHNFQHIIEPLDGHEGDAFFHVKYMLVHYGVSLLPFLALGLGAVLFKGWINRPYTIEMLVMVAAIYLFFSQVKTKMPAFTFVVAPLLFIVASYGLKLAGYWLSRRTHQAVVAILLVAVVLVAFRPWDIVGKRGPNNNGRNTQIANTLIYRKIGRTLPKDYVVFNCKSFEDTDMMFYTDLNAYHWFPEAQVLDSLVAAGHKIAIFDNHGNQPLPHEIRSDPNILLLKEPLR